MSADAQINHGQIIDEHNITRSVSMLCSDAHVILDKQLTVTCLALSKFSVWKFLDFKNVTVKGLPI